MRSLFLRVCFAFLCSLYMGNAMADPLYISVKPGQVVGSVDVSLTNMGAETVSILVWDTPFERTLSENVFLIEKASKGFPLPKVSKYTGRSVKRSKPSAEHYQIILPGKMLSTNVQLNDYYDITELGEHSVRFTGHIRYEVIGGLQGRAKSSLDSINSLTHAELLTNSVAVSLVPNLTPRLRPPTYNSCSVDQQQGVLEAANIAETLTNTAISDLAGLVVSERSESPRYKAWFGEYTDNRYNQVVANLTAIDQALENETLQFNCGCTEAGVFAFVFPAFPYSVTLCPSFWTASPNGQDSRAGTIIHEVSHFTVVASTDDHVYGQSGARALAISDPDRAIANADSYEYFTENSPTVPISQSGIVVQPITYPSLQLGVQSQGSIAEGQVGTFQVSNANRIELTSNTGDAELFVYRDDQLSDEMCRSTNRSPAIDLCEVFVTGTVYVQVRGFTDATFTITANVDTGISDDDSIELTLDVPVTDSVDANNRDIYQVSGGSIVELESLSGDADLYLFSSLDLTSESLVCSSSAAPLQSTTDTCIVPSAQSTYYVTVVGYTAANYTLLARATVSTNASRLTLGQAARGNVVAGSFAYYVVSGAEAVVLTSETGDADLLVTTDPNFQENDTSCTSVEFSANSLTDTCAVSNGGEYYILVRGYTNATYSIVANGATTQPVGDDPNATPTSVRRSGGSYGAFGLMLLLTFVGFRVTYKG